MCSFCIAHTLTHLISHIGTFSAVIISNGFGHWMYNSWKRCWLELEKTVKDIDIFIFYAYSGFYRTETNWSFRQKIDQWLYYSQSSSFQSWIFYNYPRSLVFICSLNLVLSFCRAQSFPYPTVPRSKLKIPEHLAVQIPSQFLSIFKLTFWTFYNLWYLLLISIWRTIQLSFLFSYSWTQVISWTKFAGLLIYSKCLSNFKAQLA